MLGQCQAEAVTGYSKITSVGLSPNFVEGPAYDLEVRCSGGLASYAAYDGLSEAVGLEYTALPFRCGSVRGDTVRAG